MARSPKGRPRAVRKGAPKESSANGLCPIVGMGASAGGLEAMQRFFGRLPPNSGMAFVVVQHIDPRHDTLLPELLRKTTTMGVDLAREETPLEPDHVYVIPPNAILTIEGGILRVKTPADPQSLHSPIDRLFDSLAQDQGHNAVCILLSGSGSDGTLGLRAVKEHGGMAMAQSPESAQHDGILRSAISTGLVDHVLPPEELAVKLMEYATYLRHVRVERGPEALVPAGEDELARISSILLHKTGTIFVATRAPPWSGVSNDACRCFRFPPSRTTSTVFARTRRKRTNCSGIC